ncbi:putative baseplate assembly protein [Streptomyces sp. Tu102]|uniref:putative baseplate assembly protein n=1 Tax=Streptomyces sp. Tu102 TaxID=2838019 RepID=UPI001BDD459B|nr:putative baseplate assembly protein [Streptomyces sp. Tu102]MBT1090322.1 putative baseplate assembly protein [Streptomyces sp. Tu102]
MLSLPQLDDRRWSDLVEEARALIPVYAPEWTDHNASDPGITFAELLAWVTEMDVFRLDQIPERHRRAFLALSGVVPAPPRPARTVVEVALGAGAGPVTLPTSTQFTDGAAVRVRTLRPLHAAATALVALHREDDAGAADLTDALRRRTPFLPFGPDPHAGARLVLGFDRLVPPGSPLSIVVTPQRHLDDAHLTEHHSAHHSARTVWEIFLPAGRWRRLGADEVTDRTRCLTRTDTVEVTARTGFTHLRCLLVRAGLDEAVPLTGLAVNAAVAEQSVPVGAAQWALAPGAAVPASVSPGRVVRLGVRLDAQGRVTAWDPGLRSAPRALVLDRQPHGVTVEAADLGTGSGAPEQTCRVAEGPTVVFGLWTLEPGVERQVWRRWRLRETLDASGPADPHALLDATTGRITFGDGAHGRVPPEGTRILALARSTAAQDGNLTAGRITSLADVPHNRALFAAAGVDPSMVSGADNPVALQGGSAAESLSAAELRAADTARQPHRAVTLTDHERLALQTPGTRIARAVARAGHHPAFPCADAPGVVWVTVLPYLPAGRPMPGPGLLTAVRAQLHARRVLGTRIEVTGPAYTRVTVRAQVRTRRPADPSTVPRAVAAALDAFFDPLTGGQDGTGWPLGRDVHRAELLQVIDDVPGVDHATRLELVTNAGPTCGHVCLPGNGLVESGPHDIEATS